MDSDKDLDGKVKHPKADWLKCEKIIKGEKDGEEQKPLLEDPEDEEKKPEKYFETGMRFLYAILQWCLPLIFKQKEEKPCDPNTEKPPTPVSLTMF